MTSDKLYQLMENPGLLSSETLPELRQLMVDFPYFHTVKLLYLKNLSELKDIRYSNELKKLAIGIPDRKKLFMLIEGSNYGIDLSPEKENKQQASDSFSLIDAFLSSKDEDKDVAAESSLLFQPSVSADYIYWSLTEKDSTPDESESAPLQHHELIDTFISNDEKRGPAITFPDDTSSKEPLKSSNQESADLSSASIDDSYFTETLARIYIKQKRYEKALQIIQNLSLKYPEKNVYFADQIKFLEKLIINTKK
jgi:hypothetical protein